MKDIIVDSLTAAILIAFVAPTVAVLIALAIRAFRKVLGTKAA